MVIRLIGVSDRVMPSFMIALLFALATASIPGCGVLPGADDFARHTSANWIMLGELDHGTAEGPQAMINLLCAFIKTPRPITVAIEHSVIEQPLIDAYMKSDGGSVARLTLFQGTNWDPRYQDGKGSEAMLGLFNWLRVNYQAGYIRKVSAFDAGISNDNADRNRQMAKNLERLKFSDNDAIVILTGSAHAQRVEYRTKNIVFSPPGALLPKERTVSLLIEGEGGFSYSCEDSGCHVYPVDAGPHIAPGLLLKPTERGFDGVLELGLKETASLPANRN